MTGYLLKILYVDDDADIRAIVEMSLRLDPGIDVRLAASGAEALSLLGDEDWMPDVAVLDVMMPGMDGPTLMERLRAMPAFAKTPVLFMTARGRDPDIARYRERGANGVILKPFDPIQLAQHIRALVERPGRGAPSIELS